MPEPIDLRHIPYMPVYLTRLRKSKSWLRCRRRPELAFYLLNLWMASWHEVPAGTLENDDDVLADAAMCDPAVWPQIKDEVMHGWTVTRSGRVCHSVVTEIATEAAQKIRANQKANQRRTEAARKAKMAASASRKAKVGACENQEENQQLPSVTEIVTSSVTGAEGRIEKKEVIGDVEIMDRGVQGGNAVCDREKTHTPAAEPPPPVTEEAPRQAKIDAVAGSGDHSAPPPPPPNPRGTRLPEGALLPDGWRAWAEAEAADAGKRLDVGREWEIFHDYWTAKAKDATKLSWEKTWKNWVRTAIKRTPAYRQQRTGYGGGSVVEAVSMAMQALDASKSDRAQRKSAKPTSLVGVDDEVPF